MSTYEAVRYSFNGASISGIVAVEVGTILSWSNSTLPSGYLNCDGTAVSRSTYSALFAVIGTDYGTGNGSSTFNFSMALWYILVYVCTTSIGSICSILAFFAMRSSPSSASFSKCPASVMFRT